jgi:RHS repeat-associated protein
MNRRIGTAIGLIVLLALLWPTQAQSQTPPAVVVEYYHHDALGSVRLVTDQNQQVIARHDFLPFGEEWNPPTTAKEKKLFTGHERDADTGLDYFGARYYRPQVGRFTTIDPLQTTAENLVDPQRWNRYAYARNNALKYVDPDGRDIRYANQQTAFVFSWMAARSSTLRATLDLYEGPDKPTLNVAQGDAIDDEGKKVLGTFRVTGLDVDYSALKGGTTQDEIESQGKWTLKSAAIVIDKSLAMDIANASTIEIITHEVGHSDQAARDLVGYRRDSRAGQQIKQHDMRPTEIYAAKYVSRVWQQIRF